MEKVIKGLECCIKWDSCSDCPYQTPNEYDISECTELLHKDALELLKEQDEKLKEYGKQSLTLFKIDKYFRIKDLEYLVDGIENGSIVVLQDDGHFIGSTPIKEITIKIRRM